MMIRIIGPVGVGVVSAVAMGAVLLGDRDVAEGEKIAGRVMFSGFCAGCADFALEKFLSLAHRVVQAEPVQCTLSEVSRGCLSVVAALILIDYLSRTESDPEKSALVLPAGVYGGLSFYGMFCLASFVSDNRWMRNFSNTIHRGGGEHEILAGLGSLLFKRSILPEFLQDFFIALFVKFACVYAVLKFVANMIAVERTKEGKIANWIHVVVPPVAVLFLMIDLDAIGYSSLWLDFDVIGYSTPWFEVVVGYCLFGLLDKSMKLCLGL